MPTAPRRSPSLLPQLATSFTSFPVFGSSLLVCFQLLEQATFPPASGSLYMLIPLLECPTFAYLTTTRHRGLNLGITSRRKPSLKRRPGGVPVTTFTAPWASAFTTQSPLLIIGHLLVWLVWGRARSHLPFHAVPMVLRTGLGSSWAFFWLNKWIGMVWAILN